MLKSSLTVSQGEVQERLTSHGRCVRHDLQIKENPRHRERTKRGHKRLFNQALHTLRACVDRTCASENKFKRLLLRFERIQQWHSGMKLMASMLNKLRAFCGT